VNARREFVVDTCSAALLSVHLLKRAGRGEPIVQGLAAFAQRIIGALVGAGTEAIE
jgi:hypothetical protein